MKQTSKAILLALVACSFVSASVVKQNMGKKNLAEVACPVAGFAMQGAGSGQGTIVSYASGVQAEIDQTSQTVADNMCGHSTECSSELSVSGTSSGHGCEVAKRLYRIGGEINYADVVQTSETGSEEGEYEFTGTSTAVSTTSLSSVAPSGAPGGLCVTACLEWAPS